MSQQGGTYKVQTGMYNTCLRLPPEQCLTYPAERTRPSPPPKSPSPKVPVESVAAEGDGEDWEVVTAPQANEEPASSRKSVSSHFDIRLGWGKWKFTLFSWDIEVNSYLEGNSSR